MKIWIFLKSTRNGLLKNVQYGTSKPLGSREIQKTKVGAVLVVTLYFYSAKAIRYFNKFLVNFGAL